MEQLIRGDIWHVDIPNDDARRWFFVRDYNRNDMDTILELMD